MEIDRVEVPVEEEKNKIKRPQNAYFLYCHEKRPLLKEQYPDTHLKEINKLLGVQWNNLSTEDKAAYQAQASLQSQQFKELHPDYHYERGRSKKISTSQITMDSNYQCDLTDFVTDKYTIDQIRNFMKPGETTLNYQYTDEYIRT